MQILRTMFTTWIIGLPLAILLLVPVVTMLTFVLRCIFWTMNAFQSVTTGTSLPDFWG